jgi:hypothetical protein
MSLANHKPRRGEAVWIEGEKQPNGKIIFVDWFDSEPQEVVVRFHETNEIKEYSWEDFQGNWTEAFGGTWMLHKLENGNV